VFYTPIAAADKRAAKSHRRGVDRLGDAVGADSFDCRAARAGRAVVGHSSLAIAGSAGAILAASRLNRGYIGSLRTVCCARCDRSGRCRGWIDTALMRSFGSAEPVANQRIQLKADAGATTSIDSPAASFDPDMKDILRLRSRDRDRIVEVLSREEGLKPSSCPTSFRCSPGAGRRSRDVALRKVAEERVGEAVDALIDPNQDFAVRRRLARVLRVRLWRAAAGLCSADDLRFDVRCQSARSLVAIVEKNPRIRIDSERIYEVVLRGDRWSPGVGEPPPARRRVNESPLDAFVRDRAGESRPCLTLLCRLARAFTDCLRSPDRQPAARARRSKSEGVLPAPIRQRLWPFLERRPVARTDGRARK
jgi:hypothetical protein